VGGRRNSNPVGKGGEVQYKGRTGHLHTFRDRGQQFTKTICKCKKKKTWGETKLGRNGSLIIGLRTGRKNSGSSLVTKKSIWCVGKKFGLKREGGGFGVSSQVPRRQQNSSGPEKKSKWNQKRKEGEILIKKGRPPVLTSRLPFNRPVATQKRTWGKIGQ